MLLRLSVWFLVCLGWLEASSAAEPVSPPEGGWGFTAAVPSLCPEGTQLIEVDGPEGFVQSCMDENNEVHGWSLRFHASGERREQCEARHGRLHGLCAAWYPGGQLLRHDEYRDNVREGRYAEWFENGQLAELGLYRAGEPEGPWVRYFEDGRVRARGSYQAGKLTGDWEYFDREGKPATREVSAPRPGYPGERPPPAWLRLEGSRVPEPYRVPGPRVGGPFLKGRPLVEAPELGQVLALAVRDCLPEPGEEIVLVGRRGGLVLSSTGARLAAPRWPLGLQTAQVVDLGGELGCQVVGGGLQGRVVRPAASGDSRVQPGWETCWLLVALGLDGTKRFELQLADGPAEVAALDLDGDRTQELVLAEPGAEGLTVLDPQGQVRARWQAQGVRRLQALDPEPRGGARLAGLDRFGQLQVLDHAGRAVLRRGLDDGAAGSVACRWPDAQAPLHLAYLHETRVRLVSAGGEVVAEHEAPLAFTDWSTSLRAAPVALRPGRLANLASLVGLRPAWNRSLLLVTSPDGQLVHLEVLEGQAGALAARARGRLGEELLVAVGPGRVWAYTLDQGLLAGALEGARRALSGQDGAPSELELGLGNDSQEIRDGWWRWTA
ncbi:MAG TPA: toxin-antitoxin system YwqK family antitoxin, partial [Myxococcota bacterium]|nr:toxin-antitoxin system YwqK family antitoxin [Myxococcota bacterium]